MPKLKSAKKPTKTLPSLENRVAELEHDVSAIAKAVGDVMGEPFATQAKQIIEKRQVA